MADPVRSLALKTALPALVPLLVVLAALLSVGSAAGFWFRSLQRNAAVAVAITGGDPSCAPPLICRNGCVGCHTISAPPA